MSNVLAGCFRDTNADDVIFEIRRKIAEKVFDNCFHYISKLILYVFISGE